MSDQEPVFNPDELVFCSKHRTWYEKEPFVQSDKEAQDCSDTEKMMRRMEWMFRAMCPTCLLEHQISIMQFSGSCVIGTRLPRIRLANSGNKLIKRKKVR